MRKNKTTNMHLKVGETLSNRDISRMFNVRVQRGIRYSGSLMSRINHVVLITALHKRLEDLVRNPYQDRKIDDHLLYTGEGRYGNQQMTRGNLILKQQMERNYPFTYLKRSRWEDTSSWVNTRCFRCGMKLKTTLEEKRGKSFFSNFIN